MPSNAEVIHKANTDPVMTTNNANGLLLPWQAKEFLMMTFEQTPLSPLISSNVVPTLKGQYQTFDLPEHILEIREENKDSGNRVLPTTGIKEYSIIKLVTKWAMTEDWLAENVEGRENEQTMLRGISETVAVDREDLLLNGDEDSTDAFYKMNDGVIKIIKNEGNNFDAATDGVGKKGIELLKLINQKIPSKYSRAKMKWLMNDLDAQDWQVYLHKCAVEGGGHVPDQFLTGPLNMDIIPVPKIPKGTLLLVDPKKLQEVHTHEVMIRHTGPQSESSVTLYRTTWSCAFDTDFLVIRPEAACVATGIDFTV